MLPLHSFILGLLLDQRCCSSEMAGSLLDELDSGLLPEQRESVLYRQVLERQWIDECALLALIAASEGVRWLPSVEGLIAPAQTALLRSKVPAALARRYGGVPVHWEAGLLTLAQTYPCNGDELDALAHLLRSELEVLLVPIAELAALFAQVYPSETLGESEQSFAPPVLESVKDSRNNAFDQWMGGSAVSAGSELSQEAEGRVTRYVDWVIAEAMRRGASDIHFEPMAQRFQIRCRVDGVLQGLDQPARELQEPILSRLKLMGQLDIAEKRLPQDGRFHLEGTAETADFRVSTVPSTHGEGLVVRILDSRRLQLGLAELGMRPAQRSRYERCITAPDGMLLVTGPTGSGKSTTLYAALHHLNDASRKILTVEDPVEVHMEGINQVQVRREVGMTFSAALRAMLRQAPNVIMVGEIRDRETADIAIHAALTGHAVFSTLHTNDAPGALTRLIDMGAKPFLVAAALRAVVAQRLVRRIAPGAALPYALEPWQARALGTGFEALAGVECFHAGSDHTQYKGRVAVFEMFELDDALREGIQAQTSLLNVRRHLRNRGFATLRHDAVEKALLGWTTLDEVLAVTAADEFEACEPCS